MEKVKAFCKRKNIEISVKRYLIDALGAMAQGLFASLLIGTIISTLGTQLNIPILVTVGTYAKAAVGPAMAIAIGYALQAAPLVLFSLAAVGEAGRLRYLWLQFLQQNLEKQFPKRQKSILLSLRL